MLRIIINATHTNDFKAAQHLREWACKNFGGTICVRFGTVIAEQFVVRKDMEKYVPGKEHERILHYQRERLEAELHRLRSVGLMAPGDLVLRNVEDGHPADSAPHLAVHKVYGQDLATLAMECFTGAYGLVKRDVHAQEKVPGRIPRTANEFDRGTAKVVGADTHVVAELYLPAPTNETGGSIAGMIWAPYQDAWMHDIVGRAKRISVSAKRTDAGAGVGVAPTLALVNPKYSGGLLKGEWLNDRDLARTCRIGGCCDELGLWIHIGQGEMTSDEARRQVERWARRVSVPAAA